MTPRRTGVVHRDTGPNRMTFAHIDPRGRLTAVIEAESLDTAWYLATGWGDDRDVAEQKMMGWKVQPCMVEWIE